MVANQAEVASLAETDSDFLADHTKGVHGSTKSEETWEPFEVIRGMTRGQLKFERSQTALEPGSKKASAGIQATNFSGRSRLPQSSGAEPCSLSCGIREGKTEDRGMEK